MEKDKEQTVLLYKFYKKIYLKNGFSSDIYFDNPDFIDNKEMVNELAKSTPLFINKEKKEVPPYSAIIKFYEKIKGFDPVNKEYIIQTQGEKIILKGRIFDKGFIYIEKDISNKDFETELSILFKFIIFFSTLNIFLFLYLLFGIKSNGEEKAFMEKKYNNLTEDTRKIAFEDRLTGAASRLKFEESLKDLLHLASRFEEQKFCLVMIDIDNFKSVNDTYGHDYGDIVLKEVSKTVRSHIRQSDTFARWGGEEFVILLPLVKLEDALVLTDKIRELISRIKFEKLEKVTCSFGLVEYKKSDNEELILKRADELLYKAKKNGKNNVQY